MPWKLQDPSEIAAKTIHSDEWKCEIIKGIAKKAKEDDLAYPWYAWNDKESFDQLWDSETIKADLCLDIWAFDK